MARVSSMFAAALALLIAAAPLPVLAQATGEPLDIVTEPEEDDGELDNSIDENYGTGVGEMITAVENAGGVSTGSGATLAGLDKLSGKSATLDVKTGQTVALGFLQITLGECRYPSANPSGDAYAWIVVRDQAKEAPVFQGWMIASSPALSALDHARYDVWVKACTTE